jgi:aryl-phospho-beta-D-glucosidase BglC (GH1 family)
MTDPFVTARHLRRGVNLSHWYGQVFMEPGYQPAHYDTYMQQSDLQLIASAGFDHVRFPIATEHAMAADGALAIEFVDRLGREVDRMHALGLAVIIDMHPEIDFKNRLKASEQAGDVFVRFWGALAGHFATKEPALTVFEVLNEPSLADPSKWNSIQRDAVAAIRSRAPEHTIVVSGDGYSEIPRLLELNPIDDSNLIYNFHLYDPLAFSHQGTGWLDPWVQEVRGLEYPMDPANVARLLAAASDARALEALHEYRRAGWSSTRYAKFVEPAVTWAADRGVPLTCNELGVYRQAPREARLRWLKDVTALLAQNGVGWTVWDYAGDFGVVTGERGHRSPDTDVIAALGLTESP